MSEERGPYIERCPHDRENPYAMINRDLIRDERLHPSTRWMLIYLLSMKDGWKISAIQIINHCKEHFGCRRDSVYGWIKQACDAGYMKKEEWQERGLNRCRYLLSETPKFKKSLPDPISADSTPADPVQPDHKNKQESAKADSKKDHKKEKPNDKSLELARFLFFRIQRYFPKTKQPDFNKWARDIEDMHLKEEIPYEDIEKCIVFALEDSFWCRNIRSASSLRKQYDKLYAKMTPVNNEGSFIEKNRETARELKSYLLKRDGKNDMQIFKEKIYIQHNNETLYYSMNPIEFDNILMKIYGVKKI